MNERKASQRGSAGARRRARRVWKISCIRPRPFRFRGSAGGGAGKPHGLSEPVC